MREKIAALWREINHSDGDPGSLADKFNVDEAEEFLRDTGNLFCDNPVVYNTLALKLTALSASKFEEFCLSTTCFMEQVAFLSSWISGGCVASHELASKFSSISRENLLTICTTHDDTLQSLCYAAVEGHSHALNAVSSIVAEFSPEDASHLFIDAPDALIYMVQRALAEDSTAFDNLFPVITNFPSEALRSQFFNLDVSGEEYPTLLTYLILLSSSKDLTRSEDLRRSREIELFLAKNNIFSNDTFSLDELWKKENVQSTMEFSCYRERFEYNTFIKHVRKISAMRQFKSSLDPCDLQECSDHFPDIYVFLAESPLLDDLPPLKAVDVKRKLLECGLDDRLRRGDISYPVIASYLLFDTYLMSDSSSSSFEAAYNCLKDAVRSITSLERYFKKEKEEIEQMIRLQLRSLLQLSSRSQMGDDSHDISDIILTNFMKSPPLSYQAFITANFSKSVGTQTDERSSGPSIFDSTAQRERPPSKRARELSSDQARGDGGATQNSTQFGQERRLSGDESECPARKKNRAEMNT